jgi:glycosyltransferase involved in cell wall biosynthesis
MQPLVTILIPVFNDAASARMLLDRLAVEAARLPCRLAVLFVDDGSSADEAAALPGPTAALPLVDVLRLRRNLGHQRAIAIGLAALAAGPRPDFVVVMDGDGEDDPATIAPLLEAAAGGDGHTAVFAARLKRQEGPAFVVGYRMFRLLHLLLVGADVRMGNFSVLPVAVLDRVVGISEIWNHYAAGVVHARIPFRLVPTPRGRRLAGRSKMNLPALVLHGIGALSVWSDVIVARCFLVVALLLGATLTVLTGLVSLRVFAAWLVPAWATGLVGWLVVLLLLLGIVSLLLALFVLGSRNAMNVLPHRDWRDYVLPAR